MADDRGTGTKQFLQSAEDLVTKLSEVGTAEAMGLTREAREIVSTLRGWEAKRPDDSTRIAVIGRLLDLNRRTMTFLASRQRGR